MTLARFVVSLASALAILLPAVPASGGNADGSGACGGTPTGGVAVADAPAASSPHPCVELHIRARIDGSDRLEVDRDGFRWKCTAWAPPSEPLFLAGHAWDVRREPFVPHTRWRLVPGDVDWAAAELHTLRARDLVGLERRADGAVVRFADTPNGADWYEVVLRLPRRGAAASGLRRLGDAAHALAGVAFVRAGARATLCVRARIDGSDTLVLDARGASWRHRHWAPASEVSLNGIAWPVPDDASRAYVDPCSFLPAQVDFASGVLRVRRARDTVVAETGDGRLLVHFADNPLGADDYEVDITFAVAPGAAAARALRLPHDAADSSTRSPVADS